MKWLCFLWCAGALMADGRAAPPWEKPADTALVGGNLFREYCAVCHDVDRDQAGTRKIGPSLHHLFKNPKLPLSKGRPNRGYVMVRIHYGGPVMPAFMKKIDNAQMAALLTYLESK